MSGQHVQRVPPGATGAGHPARQRSDPPGSRASQPTMPESRPRAGTARLKDLCPAPYHLIWVTAVLLLIAGLCMMLSVSAAATEAGGDRFVYIRQQGITAVVGLLLLVGISRINYRRMGTASMVFLGMLVLSLLLVHVPSLSASEGGSASWIPLGPIAFQPSEFAKLAVILAGAHLLVNRRRRVGDFASFMWPFGAVGLGMCALVMVEGDLGTAVIIAGLLLGMLWIGGMRGRNWALTAGVGLVTAVAFTFSSSERTSRVLSFLNPSADPQGASFQLSQSLVALGRGGWLGVGPGESVQKFSYLPKAHTDMIYAILGEEFGLLGAGLVLILFAVFAAAAWKLATRCADPMGKYLLAGCGMLVTLQAVVNIGGVMGALPLTGVPLPFISYGRNSLLVMFVAIGLILSVGRFGPARQAPSPAEVHANVTHIDRRRRDGGARGARAGAR